MSFLIDFTSIIIIRKYEYVNGYFRIYELLWILTKFEVLFLFNKDAFFDELTKLNISNKDLTERIKVSPGNICDWKSGRSKPSLDVVIKIADTFNSSVDQLLGRVSSQEKSNFTFAAHNELAHDLTPDQIKQLEAYAELLRNQK